MPMGDQWTTWRSPLDTHWMVQVYMAYMYCWAVGPRLSDSKEWTVLVGAVDLLSICRFAAGATTRTHYS